MVFLMQEICFDVLKQETFKMKVLNIPETNIKGRIQKLYNIEKKVNDY